MCRVSCWVGGGQRVPQTERRSVDCEIRAHCVAVMWCGPNSGPQTPGQEAHERDGRGTLGLKA